MAEAEQAQEPPGRRNGPRNGPRLARGNTRIHDFVFAVLIVVTIVATACFGWAGYRDTADIVAKAYAPQGAATTSLVQQQLGAQQINALTVYAALEGDTIVARNYRTASFLATRTWLRFLTTMFGAILIIFGAAFVLGRVTVEATKVEGSGGGISGSLATSSPGLILAVVGAGLMAWPLAAPGQIETSDAASFGSFIITEGANGGQSVTVSGMVASSAPEPPPPKREESMARLESKGILP